jgi:LAO/AO transport system kinase
VIDRLGQEVAAEGPIARRRRRARYLIARAASDLVTQRIKEGADGKLEALSDDVLAGRIRPEDAAKELVGR